MRVKPNQKVDERHARRMEIAAKFQMTKNIRGYFIFAVIIFGVAAVFTWWGFSGFKDSILDKISTDTRQIIAWIALVIAIIGLVFSILFFIGYRNAKKHVLSLIDAYDKRFPNAKYHSDTPKKEKAKAKKTDKP